jgi:hypothetical protein
MNEQATNSLSVNNLPHCSQRTRTGRLCQLPVLDAHSGLCFRHTGLRDRQVDAGDLSADLLGQLTEFKSASEVNDFLAKLLFQLVRNRISTKRAAVLTYICAQLLRTLRAIDIENNPPYDEDADPVIIFDGPRPDRSQDN